MPQQKAKQMNDEQAQPHSGVEAPTHLTEREKYNAPFRMGRQGIGGISVLLQVA